MVVTRLLFSLGLQYCIAIHTVTLPESILRREHRLVYAIVGRLVYVKLSKTSPIVLVSLN